MTQAEKFLSLLPVGSDKGSCSTAWLKVDVAGESPVGSVFHGGCPYSAAADEAGLKRMTSSDARQTDHRHRHSNDDDVRRPTAAA